LTWRDVFTSFPSELRIIRLFPFTEGFDRIELPNSLSLLTPDRLPRDVNLDDPNFDANIFDLYPDPLHFVDLLKSIDREDVSSDLFVCLLEAYGEAKSHSNGDSLRYVKIGSASRRTLMIGV